MNQQIKKRILIATSLEPLSNLGGPSKFAPLLYQSLKKTETDLSNIIFNGFFRETLYKDSNVNYVEYSRNSNKIKNKQLWFKVSFKKIELIYCLYFLINKFLINKKYACLIKKIVSDYDILHIHDFYLAFLIPNGYSGKIILTNHFKGSVFKEFISQLSKENNYFLVANYFKKIEKRAIILADCITFPSYGARDLLLKDYPHLSRIISDKSVIVYTGIEPLSLPQKVHKIKKDTNIIFLNIANHIPAKNVLLALKLFLNISKSFPEYEFKFINCGGEGSETYEIKKFISDNKMQDKVIIKGLLPKDEVLYLYSSSDFFILTPDVVVFDLVILEAMSIGLPIITTKIGGNVEALGEEYPLYYENSYEDIANKIIKLCGNPKAYNDISDYLNIRFKKNSTTSKMLSNYKDLYLKLLC